MALAAKSSLPNPELNDFLFAALGEEESGMPLSVLSALSRLDIDPWKEGARLSDLPRDVAARGLVPVIAMFPTKETRGASDLQALAERLVALLPERGPDRALGVAGNGGDFRRAGLPRLRLMGAGLLIALLAMAAFGLLPGQ